MIPILKNIQSGYYLCFVVVIFVRNLLLKNIEKKKDTYASFGNSINTLELPPSKPTSKSQSRVLSVVLCGNPATKQISSSSSFDFWCHESLFFLRSRTCFAMVVDVGG